MRRLELRRDNGLCTEDKWKERWEMKCGEERRIQEELMSFSQQ